MKTKTQSKKSNRTLAFGKRLKEQKLDSWHIGLLLAAYNSGLVVAMALLILVSINVLPLWIYLLIIAPLLFTAFWFWFTQNMLRFYGVMSIHDTLLIAKIGTAPFVLIFLVAACSFVGTMNLVSEGIGLWRFVSYQLLLFGASTIMLGLTVVTFGLRHRIRITRTDAERKK